VTRDESVEAQTRAASAVQLAIPKFDDGFFEESFEPSVLVGQRLGIVETVKSPGRPRSLFI